MKKKLLILVAWMLVIVMSFSSCAALDWIIAQIGPEVELTDAALKADKIIDFSEGANYDVLFESDGWSNGDVFNVVWKKHNVHFEDGIMRLGITEEKATAWINDAEVEYNYTAGEARTQNYYHYGDYEVSMKPSANGGTASTFFVCTGPYDLKDGVPNAHDEIDIEFLGKDTTHVQFNFFVDGKGGNEFMYDLGFDASEGFHTYGFRWEEDSITWFVDGEPVYKVTTDKTATEGKNLRIVEKIPSTAGRILTNYWCGNERAWGWMGKYNGETKDNGTTYQWIATSAEGAPLNPPVDNPPVDGGDEIDWAGIEASAPTFETTPEYTVAIDGNKANVTYTDVSGSAYKPIEMDVTELVAGKNHVYLKVTNNGTETVNVRVNMFDPTLTGNNQATNISATMNGTAVYTDTAWGGSFFDIPAGETAELVIYFGVGGVKLQLMIDSSRNDTTLRSGDVTVEEIKFAAVGEVEIPDPNPDPDPDPQPENPTSGNLTLDFGEFQTKIDGNVTDGYGINVGENNTINVEYTNIVGNSYKNFWANVSAIAGTTTTFQMQVTNNGTETVKLRVDIESKTQTSANTTCCNVSATKNGVEVYTDKEWGGSTFEIAAGETAVIEVVYDPSKQPTNIKIMVDSCQWDDSTSHAGSITISALDFTGEYVPEEPKPEEPKPEEPKIEYSDLYVEWKTENAYTITTTDTYVNAARISYADMVKNSWNNINIWVEDKSAGCSVFSMKLTNHGSATVSVWVQMKDAAGAELINQNVDIAAGEEQVFTFNYEGNAQMIFFFVDSTHEADADLNTGDITISEIKLGKVAASEEPPVQEEPTVTIPEGEYLSYTGNDIYTLSATPEQYVNSITVSYTAAKTDTYLNVNTWIKDKAAGKATLSAYITNNGTEEVKITVKLETDGASKGETTVVVAAGQTLHVELGYTEEPSMLFFFIGTGWNAEAHTQSAGNVTIAGVEFK